MYLLIGRDRERLTIKTTENFFDLLVAFAALKVRLQHHCGDMRLQFTVQENLFMIAYYSQVQGQNLHTNYINMVKRKEK